MPSSAEQFEFEGGGGVPPSPTTPPSSLGLPLALPLPGELASSLDEPLVLLAPALPVPLLLLPVPLVPPLPAVLLPLLPTLPELWPPFDPDAAPEPPVPLPVSVVLAHPTTTANIAVVPTVQHLA